MHLPMYDVDDTADFDDTFDVAEHHPACRCDECDPDTAFEFRREARIYDAESYRQSA